ncbi:MAG: response regulator [Alphaproteobacteria bacterium]
MARNNAMDLSGKSVLVVENNAHMRLVFSEILAAFQVGTVVEAQDVLGAYLLLASEKIDLILLDFFLDAGEGTELITLLRSDTWCLNQNTPVLVVTAKPRHGSVTIALEQGACAVMAKPVEPRVLYHHIVGALSDPNWGENWSQLQIAGAA